MKLHIPLGWVVCPEVDLVSSELDVVSSEVELVDLFNLITDTIDQGWNRLTLKTA
jgi:hypothetical protein